LAAIPHQTSHAKGRKAQSDRIPEGFMMLFDVWFLRLVAKGSIVTPPLGHNHFELSSLATHLLVAHEILQNCYFFAAIMSLGPSPKV